MSFHALPLTAVLFDLGDTVLDFEPFDPDEMIRAAARQSYEHLRRNGHTLPAFEDYRRRHQRAIGRAYLLGRLMRRDFNSLKTLDRLARRAGIHLDQSAMADLAWEWYGPLQRRATVEPDVIPTLQALRDANMKIGLVSNTFIAPEIHDRHLRELGLLDLLPVRVYSSQTGYRKPGGAIFWHALDRLRVTPAETLFVGDTVATDVVGAQRVGMRVALRQKHISPTPNSPTPTRADYHITHLSEVLPIVFQKS